MSNAETRVTSQKETGAGDMERIVRRLLPVISENNNLLSLYIPAGRTIADVLQHLDREAADTRMDAAGSSAIAGARALLRQSGGIPSRGLALFSGPGIAEILEPPSPVRDFFLRISTRFSLDPLTRAEADEAGGLILLDLGRAYWALARGGDLGETGHLESLVPAKHHKGGQSAARFQRLRGIAAHEFYTRVGDEAGAGMLARTGDGTRLAYVLIGGHQAAATELAAGPYLPAPVRQKIIGTVEWPDVGPAGLRTLAQRGEELFRDRKAAGDLEVLGQFLQAYSRKDDSAIAGEARVREGLRNGAVKTVFLSSSLRQSGARVTCTICGHADERTFRIGQDESVQEILAHTCRACNAPIIGDPAIDIVEDLSGFAVRSGARALIIPADTIDGRTFLAETGGIGALLRYRTGPATPDSSTGTGSGR